jgi:eIF4-gamma/eIF5/eIF2-epsilon
VIVKRLRKWSKLLKIFVQDESDQTELIFFVQQYMEEQELPLLEKCFTKILHTLYNLDVVEEDAIFAWADEQKDMTGEDRRFLKYAKPLIEWLQESSDDESE